MQGSLVAGIGGHADADHLGRKPHRPAARQIGEGAERERTHRHHGGAGEQPLPPRRQAPFAEWLFDVSPGQDGGDEGEAEHGRGLRRRERVSFVTVERC